MSGSERLRHSSASPSHPRGLKIARRAPLVEMAEGATGPRGCSRAGPRAGPRPRKQERGASKRRSEPNNHKEGSALQVQEASQTFLRLKRTERNPIVAWWSMACGVSNVVRTVRAAEGLRRQHLGSMVAPTSLVPPSP